jgi:flagellar biosynthesis/type III secretory pathway chaperone
MTADATKLLAALEEKHLLLGRLEELLTLEQQAITNLDLAELDQLDQQKRHLLVDLEGNSNGTRLLLRTMADQANLAPTVTLSPVIATLATPQKERCTQLQTALFTVGKRVDRLLDFNRQLLQTSLATVTTSLDFFNRLFSRGTTYGDAGKMRSNASGVQLVSQEA